MRLKSAALLLVFILLVFVLPSVFAQNITLSQIFTSSDKSFTVKYPSSWVILAEDTTDVRFSPTDGSANSLAVEILTTDAKTLEDAIKPTQQSMNGMTEVPAVVESNGRQMLYVEGTPYDNLIAGVLFDNGKIAYVIGFTDSKDKSQWKQVVLDEAASLEMAGAQPIGGSVITAEATAEATTAEATTAAPSAVGSLNPTQLWSVKTVGAFGGDVAFSPDGKYVAALGTLTTGGPPANDVVLLDAASGKLVQTFTGHERSVSHIAFSPDGATLASADTETLRLWDVASGKEKLNLQKQVISNLAFSPDGASLAFAVDGNPDATIDLLDVASGTDKVAFSKDRQTFTMHHVAYTPDGSLLFDASDYTSGADSHATVWQLKLETGEAPSIFDQPGSPLALLYPASGNPLVVISDISGNNVSVWDLKSASKLYDLPAAKTKEGDTVGTTDAALNPTGSILATAAISVDGQLWDAQTGTPLGILDQKIDDLLLKDPRSFAFSPDGQMVVVGYTNSNVIMWSLTGAAAPATGDATATTGTDSTGTSGAACTITAPQTANLRSGPGTTFAKAGSLNAGSTASVDGQAQSSDGKTWYQTTDKTWVRSDLVTAAGDCASVPTVTP